MADTSIRVDDKTRDRLQKSAKRHGFGGKIKPYLDFLSRTEPSKLDVQIYWNNKDN